MLAKLALSPNGKFVVLKDSSLLKVLDIEKGRAVFETKSYGYAFAVSPDNRVIAVYDRSSIQLLDAATGATILKSDVGDLGGDAPGISFNKNGSLIAAFGLRGIRLVDGKTAKLLFEMK